MKHATLRADGMALKGITTCPCASTRVKSLIRAAQRLCFAFLLFGTMTLFQGCDNRRQPAAESGDKRLHLAFVANSRGEYWAIVNLGCDIAAQQLGNVDVDFRYPSEPTVKAQHELLATLVRAGVDGIAVSPIDPDRQTDYLNSIAEKTLLICADSDAAQSKRISYIGTDNMTAGSQAANLVREALPDGGKIALFVGYANAQNTKDRIQALRNGLAGSRIEIADTLEDGQNSATARTNVALALTKTPDLAGVIGISGYHGPALLTALREAGKAGKVKIVCFDDNDETLAGILAGDIHGTVAQKPFQIGKEAIVHMENYLRGGKARMADSKIYTASRLITRTNVEHYIAEQRNISAYLKGNNP